MRRETNIRRILEGEAMKKAELGSSAVLGMGLRPLACWYCRFKFRRGYSCLSLVGILMCIIVIIIIIIIIILGISFMQGIYTYNSETNNVPREHCVATILM
jgi:predicted PurR-regulated permease PerM